MFQNPAALGARPNTLALTAHSPPHHRSNEDDPEYDRNEFVFGKLCDLRHSGGLPEVDITVFIKPEASVFTKSTYKPIAHFAASLGNLTAEAGDVDTSDWFSTVLDLDAPDGSGRGQYGKLALRWRWHEYHPGGDEPDIGPLEREDNECVRRWPPKMAPVLSPFFVSASRPRRLTPSPLGTKPATASTCAWCAARRC